MITISESQNTLPTIQEDNYKTFFQQERMKFLSGSSWRKITESFWREMRLNVSANDVDALISFLRNKRDAILQAYKQEEFFVFWNRCFDSTQRQFDEDKFIRLLCVAYSDNIERSDLDAFFAWYCLTECIDELLTRVFERQKSFVGATINFFYNDGGEIHFGTPSGKQTNDAPAEDEPLRNIIFNERLFDSNAWLLKLRDTIAAAIDMGDATIMYGHPQQVRINPSVKNEWYYVMKAVKEAGITKSSFGDTTFVEQMVEWFPMLFPDDNPEKFKDYKRKLARSVSGERSLWKKGKMKQEVTLKDMWAKGMAKVIGAAKAERVYEIAYKGLFASLVVLKHDIERAKTEAE